MFKEETLAEFVKNNLTPEEPYDDDEMSINLEEGSIIYKKSDRIFLVSDYTFWEPVTLNQYKNINDRIRASLIHETEPFAIEFLSSENGFIFLGFEFINIPAEKECELRKLFNEITALYEFEGRYIKQRKNNLNRTWYRTETNLTNDKFSIEFDVKTLSFNLAKTTPYKRMILSEIKHSGDILNELFSQITELISIDLVGDGVKHSTEIHPYGFRLDVLSGKENLILDFEYLTSNETRLTFVVSEYKKKENGRVFTGSFFEDWNGNGRNHIYINFENGYLKIIDNELLDTIKRRQITSYFSIL